jgi:hypothetical protein
LFTLGSFFNSAQEAIVFGLLFSRYKLFTNFFAKDGMGYILGDFFPPNSSGHRAQHDLGQRMRKRSN